MNAGVSLPARHDHPNIARFVVFIAILAWAGFWTWFVVLDGLNDARTLGSTTYWIMSAILAGLWIPTLAAWRRPLWGAAAMAIAGVLALWFFPGAFARAVLAGPPIVFALALVWIASRERAAQREGR